MPCELAAKRVFERGLQATADKNSGVSSSRRDVDSDVIERTTLKRYFIRGFCKPKFFSLNNCSHNKNKTQFLSFDVLEPDSDSLKFRQFFNAIIHNF